MPDPDLVIRTADERRSSNFLLWQAAGSFFWSAPVCWPDFQETDPLAAIRAWREYKEETSVESTGITERG